MSKRRRSCRSLGRYIGVVVVIRRGYIRCRCCRYCIYAPPPPSSKVRSSTLGLSSKVVWTREVVIVVVIVICPPVGVVAGVVAAALLIVAPLEAIKLDMSSSVTIVAKTMVCDAAWSASSASDACPCTCKATPTAECSHCYWRLFCYSFAFEVASVIDC